MFNLLVSFPNTCRLLLHLMQTELSQALIEAKNEVQRLKLEVQTLQQTVAMKEEEIEEKQCQTTSYYNALEVGPYTAMYGIEW